MLLRGLLLLLLFWMIARAFWRLLEGVVRGATQAGPQGSTGGTSRSPVAVKMSPCPVCGTFVVPGKAISLTRGGQAVYFCSEKCRSEYLSR